jgi:predicted dehydrogenase
MIPFGIIGTSTIAHNFVSHAQASGQWTLNAVYSRNVDTARTFASKHSQAKTPEIHTKIENLAASPSIQVVYIASPNSLHFSQVKLCLEHSKHVIVEKPATSTLTELAILLDLAKEKHVFLLEANRHLHELNFKRVAQNLHRVGRIYGASFTYASYSSRYTAVLTGSTPNIFSLEFSGGSLVDIGVYPISAALALFGVPRQVSYDPVIVRTGVDGGGPVVLRYDGFAVMIGQSKVYTSAAPSEVYGELGTLRFDGVTDISEVEFVDAKTKEVVKLGGEKERLNLVEECREFARIVTEGDWGEAEKLESISRATIEITEKLRRDNGIVFACEREVGKS